MDKVPSALARADIDIAVLLRDAQVISGLSATQREAVLQFAQDGSFVKHPEALGEAYSELLRGAAIAPETFFAIQRVLTFVSEQVSATVSSEDVLSELATRVPGLGGRDDPESAHNFLIRAAPGIELAGLILRRQKRFRAPLPTLKGMNYYVDFRLLPKSDYETFSGPAESFSPEMEELVPVVLLSLRTDEEARLLCQASAKQLGWLIEGLKVAKSELEVTTQRLKVLGVPIE